MEAKPRRLRFRYSLRTLLVAVTGLCVWLAWQANVVRERRSVLSDLERRGCTILTAKGWQDTDYGPGAYKVFPVANVPWYRSLMGDEAIQIIYATAELESLKVVFPEAVIRETPPYLEPHRE